MEPLHSFSDRKNNSIALVYRARTPAAKASAQDLAAWLKTKKVIVYTGPDQKLIPGTLPLKTSKQINTVRLFVVLGGDGTYLRAVRLLDGRQIPIVGFNMGSLGFLTNHTIDEMQDVIEKTLDNKMRLQARALLVCEVRRKSKTRGIFQALNDVVIERGPMSQLISTAIYIDKLLVSEVKADGIIISSPTGSTAYNLAAGGPILDPEVKALVVTPIAPHSLTSRPLIFPDNRNLSFKLEGKIHRGNLVIDGQRRLEISNTDEILIHRSKNDHLLVRAPSHNFYHLLREKLKFGDRS
ncbi:MAG: NAD(+)/NADH kinase [Bdellovibrionaceae bacterium]|nr:NAD(+)/NADH kinase [Pseudobdellovibrionaceae bacterium]